jgi:hypothetical protein
LTIALAVDCACAGGGAIVANSRAAENAIEYFTAMLPLCSRRGDRACSVHFESH